MGDYSLENCSGLSVEQIIANLDDDCGFIDEQFSVVCNGLLGEINRERELNGVAPYNEDQTCILVNELYKVGRLFRDEVRKDGSSVFYSHLVGAVNSLVCDQGITGLVSVLSTLYHDVIEDLEGKIDCSGKVITSDVLKSRIVDVSGYDEALLCADGSSVEDIRNKVWEIVNGVTKLRKETRFGTRMATLKKFFEVALENIRVINTKIADRTHNVFTIGGHKDNRRQVDIIKETEDVYIPLTRILGLANSTKKLVYRCMEFFNPSLLRDFMAFSNERVRSSTKEYGGNILSKFVKKRGGNTEFLNGISDVALAFMDISYYTAVLDKSFEELCLDDLNIGNLDPMYEWLVLVEKQEDKKRISSMILDKFASDKGARAEEDVPADNDPFSFSGIVVTVFNKEYGGQLHFRINDKISENRSKRGILAGTNDLVPGNVRELIRAVLDDSTQIATGARNIMQAAEMELLRPRITVFARNGAKIVLPEGATALDFAAAINKDLLIGLNGASMNDSVVSRSPDRAVSPFDKLIANKVYFIDSCLSPGGKNRKIDSSKIEVDPGWLLFSQVRARKHIVSYLQDKKELASNYLKKVSDVYGVSEKFLFESLDEERPISDLSKKFILKGVLTGDFNPVLSLANRLKDKKLWRMSVDLEDRPGELNAFTSEFPREDVFNLGKLTEGSHVGALQTIEFNVDCGGDDEFLVYKFFRKLLKLSYKYKIKLLDNVGGENMELEF